MTVQTSTPTPAVATIPSAAAEKAAVVQTPPKDAPPAEKIRVRAHDRARNVKAKLEEESERAAPEPAAERETAGAQGAERRSSAADSDADTTEPKRQAAEPEKAPDDAEARRAARLDRLRKAQERERAEDQARSARAQKREPDREVSRELETLRKRVAELEPHEKVFASEEALLEAAEQKGLSAEKLVQWMRTRLSDPAAVARQHAKTEADRLREEIAELRKEQARDRAEREEAAERSRLEQEGLAKAHRFVDRVKSSETSHPLATSFLKRYGDVGLVQFANQFIAPHLRGDYDVEELHDHVEQLLEELQVGGASPPATPANGASPPPKNGAAQPVTTLSNSIASQRGSVTEATPLHLMPKSERIARLKQKLGGE